MKSNSGAILGLTLLAGLLAAARRARRGCAARACEVPDYLLTSESALPKVAEAVKSGHPLDILVVGSRSSTIPYVGGQRLSRPAAGDAEGETALDRG